MISTLAGDVYSIAEAARLLNMPSATLTYWLEGRSKVKPVLRPKSTGRRTLTWGEFVEAGLLRQYRTNHLPMAELRVFISALRDELGVPYPLAHARPFMSRRDLLWGAQQRAQLPTSEALVSERDGQYLLLPAADAFLQRVDFAGGDTARRWRPASELEDVVLDPEHRFGAPTIAGIRTRTLWEAVRDTDDVNATADLYGLMPQQVHQALAFEELQRSRAA